MRARLNRLNLESPPTPAAAPTKDQHWPKGWSQPETTAARFIAHVISRLRAREWGHSEGRLPVVWRPPIRCKCGYGQNLASRGEFEEQARRANKVLDWDRAQAHLLKRLEAGRAPLVLDLFCCARGFSEGFRRGGGTSYGVDLSDQPYSKARFGVSAKRGFTWGAPSIGKL